MNINTRYCLKPGAYTIEDKDGNKYDVVIEDNYKIQFESAMKNIMFNLQVLNQILSNTIDNENGIETNTCKFRDIKSFATYIKSMNEITLNYINEKMERSNDA